jgi:hypothetical protein
MVYCFLTLQQASIVVPRRKMQANCSWCFESSTHFLDRETTKWICQACLGAGERCMASGCAVRTRALLLFSPLLFTFGPQGIIRCEVISQGSACVTCAGLWAKTSQTRASVFEHNRDVAGVRFELRSDLLPLAHYLSSLIIWRSRPSDFRTQAQEAGMLRPFLMLVSMSPAMRCILAVQVSCSHFHFGAFKHCCAAWLEHYSRATLW